MILLLLPYHREMYTEARVTVTNKVYINLSQEGFAIMPVLMDIYSFVLLQAIPHIVHFCFCALPLSFSV